MNSMSSPASVTNWPASFRNATACPRTRLTANSPTGKSFSTEPALKLQHNKESTIMKRQFARAALAAALALGFGAAVHAETHATSLRSMDQDVPGLPPTPVSKDQYNLAKDRIAEDAKTSRKTC